MSEKYVFGGDELKDSVIFARYEDQCKYWMIHGVTKKKAFVYPTMTCLRMPRAVYGHSVSYVGHGEIFMFGGTRIRDEKEIKELENDKLEGEEIHPKVVTNEAWLYQNDFQPNKIQQGHYLSMGNWKLFEGVDRDDDGDEIQILKPRTHHTAATFENYVFVFGGEGQDKKPFKDMWCFDVKNRQWIIVGDGPIAVSHHSAVIAFEVKYDASEADNFLNKRPDENEKENVEFLKKCVSDYNGFWKDHYRKRFLPDAPNVDVTTRRLLVYGGKRDDGKNSNEVWEYHFGNKSWNQLKDGPSPARRGHSACFWNGFMIIFGGITDDKQFLNELWKYNTNTQKASKVELEEESRTPQGRTGHNAILIGSRYFIFGGHSGSKVLSDCWYFDLIKNQWFEIEFSRKVHGRWYSGLCYANNHQVAIIGGTTGSTKKGLQNVELIHLPFERIQIRDSRIDGAYSEKGSDSDSDDFSDDFDF